MGKRRRNFPKSGHAEGEHGNVTHNRIIQELGSGAPGESWSEEHARTQRRDVLEGKRRLLEDRQQHDEAEKHSEQTRIYDVPDRGSEPA